MRGDGGVCVCKHSLPCAGELCGAPKRKQSGAAARQTRLPRPAVAAGVAETEEEEDDHAVDEGEQEEEEQRGLPPGKRARRIVKQKQLMDL